MLTPFTALLLPFEYPGLHSAVQPPGPVWLHRLLGEVYFQTVVGAAFESGQDADVEALHGLRDVKVVMLESNRYTDAALAQLAAFPDLETLLLVGPQITDDGLQSLEKLSKLKQLAIWGGDKLTDRGIAGLKQLRGLQSLSVGYNISPQAVAALKQSLPQTQISYEP